MLKFQNNHTTEIETFEDFILTVYVMIDDLYREYAPKTVSGRRHIQAKLSDPEIITIAICGELAGIDSENAWFSFVKRNYRHLFPRLCSRSRFNRTRYCHSFRGYGADYGKCPSKKETYFGYKVHAMVTLEGFLTAFEITPASVDDREGLRDIVSNNSSFTVFDDKGYVGETLTQELKEQGICLMSLKRSNSKNN